MTAHHHEVARAGLGHLQGPLVWGVAVGVLQAASPLAFWWLRPATVYAFGLAIIAAIYVGFAVADGRRKIVAVEVIVAALFIVVAAAGVTGSPWLIVIGLLGHGLKDTAQHRTHFVQNTRWWPPFCAAVDWTAATILAVMLTTGGQLH